MTKAVQPLTHPQQIFLQRILASHILTDEAAQQIWNEIHAKEGSGRDLNHDLKKTFSTINKSLKPGFNMEIRSISLALQKDESSSRNERNSIVYHTIVNCEADHTNSVLTKTPHDLAFIRLVLEQLIRTCSDHDIESDQDDDPEDQPTSSAGNRRRRPRNSIKQGGMMGCEGSMSRMELINLRMELSGPHKDKLSISQVELIIENLEAEGWLVPVLSLEGDERQVRRKTSSDGEAGPDRLQIGPRTYMELPDFLCQIGMDEKSLPQIILY